MLHLLLVRLDPILCIIGCPMLLVGVCRLCSVAHASTCHISTSRLRCRSPTAFFLVNLISFRHSLWRCRLLLWWMVLLFLHVVRRRLLHVLRRRRLLLSGRCLASSCAR
jgi:hypothetical protein